MKKLITIVAVTSAIIVLGVTAYVFAEGQNSRLFMGSYGMHRHSQQSFDQMYEACRGAADDEMRQFMDSYGKDRMKNMHERMFNSNNGMMR